MTTKSDIRVDEVVPHAGPRKIAVSIAVGILVVVCLNLGAKLVLDRRTTNTGYWLISAKWQLLNAQTTPVEWLVLGDSSANQGVRGDVLSTKLGTSVLNLATLGDMLVVHDAWALREYIRTAGPPRNVVLVHVFDVWPREISTRQRNLLARIPLPWGFWKSAVPPLSLRPREQVSLFLERYAPLYADNVTVADWAMHPLKPWRDRPSMDRWGYMRTDVPDPRSATRDGEAKLAALMREPLAISEPNAKAVAAVLALAEQYNFRVVLAHAPVVDVLGSKPEYIGRIREFEKTLRSRLKQTDRLSVVLDPPVTFPASAMQNADHVTHEAAAIYTERLASALLALPGMNVGRKPTSAAEDVTPRHPPRPGT